MSIIKVHTDLRASFADVGNQGRRPTCLSFATTSAHEALQRRADSLCIEWLYYHAVKHAGDPPNAGSSLQSTRHVLIKNGQPAESFWPYVPSNVDPNHWQPPTPAPAQLFHAETLDVSSALSEISTNLGQREASIIGLNIGTAFHNVDRSTGDAVVPDETEHPSQGAGHALLAVGSGELGNTSYLLIRNSWGPRWGDNGHAWISESYVRDRWMGGFRLQEI